MSTDRLSTVLAAIAADGSPTVVERVCRASVELLNLSGAGLSLIVDDELCGTAGVFEPGVAEVQELQLTLGEGPCVDAWKSGLPVLEPDLSEPETLRWPSFAPAAVGAKVLAIFALPLHIGAISIGVLVLYRDRAGSLEAEELALGLVLADIASHAILSAQRGVSEDGLSDVLAREPQHWAEVHQATGMVSAQLDVPLDEAFVRLRAHAFAHDLPLREVAREVVGRRLRLEGAG